MGGSTLATTLHEEDTWGTALGLSDGLYDLQDTFAISSRRFFMSEHMGCLVAHGKMGDRIITVLSLMS